MEVNETRNCLVTDILLNIKNWLYTFKNSKTQLFKLYLFPKKVEYPFNSTVYLYLRSFSRPINSCPVPSNVKFQEKSHS